MAEEWSELMEEADRDPELQVMRAKDSMQDGVGKVDGGFNIQEGEVYSTIKWNNIGTTDVEINLKISALAPLPSTNHTLIIAADKQVNTYESMSLKRCG